jgi:uncharacterized membrane protein
MSDTVIKIYLLTLIFMNVAFGVLYVIFWLAQSQRPRHPLVKRKLRWRQVFFFLSGVVGWYLFTSRVLSNSMVLVATLVMLVVSYIAAEALGREPTKNDGTNRVT